MTSTLKQKVSNAVSKLLIEVNHKTDLWSDAQIDTVSENIGCFVSELNSECLKTALTVAIEGIIDNINHPCDVEKELKAKGIL